ncbi:MAG: THUMP domain-containing class I SAM-dependent RNA methyltransferase [Planctomycetota bacterium]
MYEYQKRQEFFAQVAGGMEPMAAEELKELGATDTREEFRGVFFKADKEALYRVTYRTRLITRILAPLVTFNCYDENRLYTNIKKIDWPSLFDLDQTFAIQANVYDSRITHSKYAALKTKDAIVDLFRERFGERPNVDTKNPDLWLHVFLRENRATVHLEVSGGSLHKRGYRGGTVEAPMQETLAAGLVRLSGWDGQTQLYDVMCGSGTILCEALMSYCRIPSGYLRERFGFEALPDFDRAIWERVKAEADGAIRPMRKGLIRGCDIDPEAVAITRGNLERLPHGDAVEVATKDALKIESLKGVVIVTNPPYGLRLGAKGGGAKRVSDREARGGGHPWGEARRRGGRDGGDRVEGEMELFFKSFGDWLKQRCGGTTAYVYFGDRSLIKSVGLRAGMKKPLRNGGLDGRLAKFEVYESGVRA